MLGIFFARDAISFGFGHWRAQHPGFSVCSLLRTAVPAGKAGLRWQLSLDVVFNFIMNTHMNVNTS